MTVPTSDNREEYTGNDATTSFDYAFKIFEDSDLQVYLQAADGTETLLVLNTDYSVSGAGDLAGGSVTYPLSGDPLASDEKLIILRVLDVVQETDLRNQGAYYPQVVEDEFDRSRMIDQQQQEEIDRALKRPAAEDGYDADGRQIKNGAAATDGADFLIKSQVDNRFANDVITKTAGNWDAKGLRLLALQTSDTPQSDEAVNRQHMEAYFNSVVLGGGPYANLRSELSSPDAGKGSDLIAHTGTSDTVTEALDKRTIFVGSVAELEAVTVAPADGTQYSVTGYYVGSDVGGGPFYWDASSTETANGVTIFKATAITTGRFKRIVSEGFLTPEMGGVLLDGSDQTAEFKAAAEAGYPLVANTGNIGIDAITFSATVNILVNQSAKITLLTPSVANSVGITLASDNSSFVCNGVFDGNTTGRSLVSVTANNCVAILNEAKNVNAGVGSTDFTSGIEITGNNCEYFVDGENFTNTGQPNDSSPRLVSIQGTASGCRGDAKGSAINAGIITGPNVGTNKCGYIDIEQATDNGLYNLGGIFQVDNVVYDGVEEGIVNLATLTVGEYTFKGLGIPLGLQDSAYLNVGSLTILQNSSGESASSIIRTRADNTASGEVVIGRINGEFTGSTLWSMTVGTVDKFSVESINLTYNYDAGVSGAITSWGLFTSAKSFDIRNVDIKVVDVNGVLTGSDYFAIKCPTTNLASVSYWHNVDVVVVQSDRLTTSSAEFRGFDIAQDLIHASGVVWQTNIGPYAKQKTYFGGQRDSVTGTPTIGTWRAGTDFVLVQATAAPFRTRCTVSGTPGTWVDY